MQGANGQCLFDDEHAINLAVYLKPGVDPESVRRRWAAANPGIGVRTNARLREEVLTIFRQTFSITYALKGIGVAVAVKACAPAVRTLLMTGYPSAQIRREALVAGVEKLLSKPFSLEDTAEALQEVLSSPPLG